MFQDKITWLYDVTASASMVFHKSHNLLTLPDQEECPGMAEYTRFHLLFIIYQKLNHK